jgi:transposase
MGVKKYDSVKLFKDKIKQYKSKIYCPNINETYNNIITNSCFDIKKCKSNIKYNEINIKTGKIPNKKEYNYCKKVMLYPNRKQKKIIKKWLDAYLQMYNITINYIKNNLKKHDFKIIKDLYNKKIKLKKEIINIKKIIINNHKQKNTIIKKLDKKFIQKRKTVNIKNLINDYINEIRIINNKNRLNNMKLNNIDISLKHIENQYKKQYILINNFIDWYKVRNTIKDKRDKLINELFINDDKPIKKHILDCAIKLACTSYKQCYENFLQNNINNFRVRFWRKNRKTLQMEIGSEFVKQLKTDKTYNICYDVFGKLKCYYNNKPYEIERKTVIIHYNQINKVYMLLVAETNIVKDNKKTKYIAIDEGIRTFCTGITNDEAIKIGTNISSRIRDYLKRIDKINKIDSLTQKEQAKKTHKYYRKINNIVSELHWKTIKYLIDNYKIIVIGNLSMKNASQKGNLNTMTKRIGLMLSHYKFRQRLQYKCVTRKNNMEIINESYTSKVCSNCSNYKKELRNEKIYSCDNCGKQIDRDINGCRGILIKSLE